MVISQIGRAELVGKTDKTVMVKILMCIPNL